MNKRYIYRRREMSSECHSRRLKATLITVIKARAPPEALLRSPRYADIYR